MDDANVWWIMDNGFVCDVLWMVDVYVMGYGCVCDGIWMCMWYILCCVLIYMWFLCLCWWKAKNKKNSIFPSLPSATLGKEGFAECSDHGTRQSWEAETQFPSFAECQSYGTRQRFFLKRKNFFAECKSMALGKEFSKKRNFFLPSAAEVALGKETVRFDVGFFLLSADVTLGKGFTECPICGTQQRNLCRRVLCDCSLPSAAIGKASESSSEHTMKDA